MAELKLNVYKGRKIEKTYTAETFDIMTGTVEDIMSLVDIDKFGSSKSDESIQSQSDESKESLKDNMSMIVEFGRIIKGAFGIAKPLIKEIFDGITDDEIRRTIIKDIAKLFMSIATFGMAEMKGTSDEKNDEKN